jgi:hypothetical protein
MERVIMLAGGKKWAHSGLWSMPDKFDQARERSYTAEESGSWQTGRVFH